MKKRICTSLWTISFVLTIQAQLVVNNDGHVIVGAEDYNSSVANSNASALYIEQSDANGMFLNANNANQTNPTHGINLRLQSGHHEPAGIYSHATGDNTNRIKGVHGHALGGRYNIGVLGSVGATEDMLSGAGVFGSNTSYPIPFSGVWAGYFQGNIKVVSNIYGTLMSSAPSSTSNASYDIMNIEQTNIADRLQKIDLLKWEKKNEDTDEKTSHIGYGLAADQVREIFPELVVEDEYGNPCINYVEMVPLLVQTIKDLNARIDKLEGIDSKPTKAKTTNIETLSSEDICNLSQNTPNPFTTSTTIKMNIPSSVRNATLRIYDMTGKQVRSIMIEERGAVSISLSSESLYSGMYIYTLIADGNVINSRRMIME